MTREGTVFGGKYRLVRLVGEGGMGAVWEAEHVEIRRKLAVKVMRAELAGDAGAAQRFRREALAAGSLGHDHICAALDVGTAPDGAPYLVMELLKGESLAARLSRSGPIAPRAALSIAAQALDALACAHDAGVVHRDLKPENVFLVKMGEVEDFVRVLDFGVSKFMEEEAGAAPVTGAGRVVGTPHYMAPEQARAQRDQDHRVDVYAAGVLLFEMATGRRPFEGESFPDLLVRIATDPFPAPRSLRPDVPAAYEAIVLRAVARNRADRFPDARTMRDEVLRARDAIADGVGRPAPRTIPTSAGEPTPLGPTTPSFVGIPAPRSKRGPAIVVAVGIAALALAAWAMRSPGEAPPARTERTETRRAVAAPEPPEPSTTAAATTPAPVPPPTTSAPVVPARPRVRPRTASAPPAPGGEKLDFAR